MSAADALVILTVNGPGELLGWAEPLTAAIKDTNPSCRVALAIVPCVYASGAEHHVAATLPCADMVLSSAETMSWIVKGAVPAGVGPAPPAWVVHLGGEPLLSLALGRRARARTAVYLEGPLAASRWFDRRYARDEDVRQRSHGRATVVGDLMVDAARQRCPVRLTPRADRPPTIGIFPGSRRPYYRRLLPFFMLAAARFATREPRARWLIARAPFVSVAELTQAASTLPDIGLEGETAAYDAGVLESRSGLRFEIRDAPEVLAEATAVLTLPGTSTAELAALGIPCVVCAPTYRVDEVPLPGLLGHLDRFPAIGRAMKTAAVRAYGRRFVHLSHPNRRAARQVVPELVGRITPEDVAEALAALLARDGQALSAELIRIMGPAGASGRLARDLLTR